jgi:hypothetical protein
MSHQAVADKQRELLAEAVAHRQAKVARQARQTSETRDSSSGWLRHHASQVLARLAWGQP